MIVILEEIIFVLSDITEIIFVFEEIIFVLSDITKMASRGGKMVAGTDGMDFTHRERVADQYSVSASNKSRLKLLAITHLLLGVVHNIRLLPFLLTLVGVKFPAIPLLKHLPSPSEVEYAWLASLPFVFMALSAIKRSKSGMKYLYITT